MANRNNRKDKFKDLRISAEKLLAENLIRLPKPKAEDIQKMVHELNVYQIELEMQNETLLETQRQLEESIHKYTDLYDYAPVGYFTCDEKGLILEANLALASLIGKDRASFIGTSFYSSLIAEDRDILYLHLKKIFEAKGPQKCELRLSCKGKELHAQLESIVVEAAGHGSPVCRTSVIDITERKKAEAELLKLNEDMAARNEALERLNKELDAFVFSVSRELRAPLRIVEEFAKIVLQDYSEKLDAEGKDHLHRIGNGAARMTRLIQDLLRLSHISRQEMNRINYDLSSIVSSVISGLRRDDPTRNVEPVIEKSLRAHFDPELMKMALLNLVANAWKFTSGTEKTCIEFGAANQNGKFIYFVRDNGAGFDQAYVAKLFLPFQRLHSDKEFEGTGMGLSIVERIIHRHGGRIWAEGAVGKGATFYFTLE